MMKEKVKELMPPPATTKDYIYLAVACIVAAYASRGEEAPNHQRHPLQCNTGRGAVAYQNGHRIKVGVVQSSYNSHHR